MDPHSFEGESVHGKTMTPLFIIDPCVEIVNPMLLLLSIDKGKLFAGPTSVAKVLLF
jgi:hypothetical protein